MTTNPAETLNASQSGLRNRWERAYAVLQTSKDSKKYIAQYERILSQEILNNPNEPLLAAMKTKECQQQISTLAHKKLKEAERSHSEIQRQIDRIVKSVLFFRDFVSSAVSSEPHAALVWAGVCIFLPVGCPRSLIYASWLFFLVSKSSAIFISSRKGLGVILMLKERASDCSKPDATTTGPGGGG